MKLQKFFRSNILGNIQILNAKEFIKAHETLVLSDEINHSSAFRRFRKVFITSAISSFIKYSDCILKK